MPLLVNQKTRTGIICRWILEVAPIVLPCGLTRYNHTYLCVGTLKALISNVVGATSHEPLWAVRFLRVNSSGEASISGLGSTFQASIGGTVIMIARFTRDVLTLLFYRARLIGVACLTFCSSNGSILCKVRASG